MKYKFKSLKQRLEWQDYLRDVGETPQEALSRLINREIKNNKDLNEWSKKTSKEND